MDFVSREKNEEDSESCKNEISPIFSFHRIEGVAEGNVGVMVVDDNDCTLDDDDDANIGKPPNDLQSSLLRSSPRQDS